MVIILCSCWLTYFGNTSLKIWIEEKDKILSLLCKRLINRDLFRVELQNIPFDVSRIQSIKDWVVKEYKIDEQFADYFVFSEIISNYAYDPDDQSVQILLKDGRLHDISKASDIFNDEIFSKKVKKYCLCYPKKYHI